MDELDKFVKNLKDNAKKQVPMQVVWVTVDEVTWTADKKVMDCTGVADELEYFGIRLGAGSEFKKPTQGSLCLIGAIANNDAAGYLIYASEVEEIVWVDSTGFEVKLSDGELSFNGNQYSIVKAEELKSVMDTNKQIMNIILPILTGSPINETGNGAPSSLQAALIAAYQGAGSPQWGDHSNIASNEVKHG